MTMFTTKFWLILSGFLLLLVLISTLVAYFRGKRAGATTAPTAPQIAPKADSSIQVAMEKAQADLKTIEAETKKRRDELEAVLAVKEEKDRLAALAALANKWKMP
jgi:flagellar biosynthesis/type III secretory pathway M-ring protein FliF/YscJ